MPFKKQKKRKGTALHTREKGVINLVLTIVIAIFINQLQNSWGYWIGIVLVGIIQIAVVFFIPSIEELEHQEREECARRQNKIDMDFAEKTKKFKLSKKFKKMQENANKDIKKKDVKYLDKGIIKHYYSRRR